MDSHLPVFASAKTSLLGYKLDGRTKRSFRDSTSGIEDYGKMASFTDAHMFRQLVLGGVPVWRYHTRERAVGGAARFRVRHGSNIRRNSGPGQGIPPPPRPPAPKPRYSMWRDT